MNEFVHLHLHTEFSLLDGMGRTSEYVAKAVEDGMKHVAITDHGVMYGAMEWYKAAIEAGIHPIIGMEAYLAEGKATERERSNYHLLLLAENDRGYRNLLKLASRASLEGFYYRPRVDLSWLQELHEGIIATSACIGGPVAKNFLQDRPDQARTMAGTLAEIFGPERFFIEVQDHGVPLQVEANRQLLPLAKSLGLPVVATNDVHYANQGDAPAQDVLVCVQTNTTIHDTKRLKSESDQLYFKTAAEMWQVFGELPEALTNTIRIAEMCSLDLGFRGYHLPEFDVPAGTTPDDYLERLCREGVRRLYGQNAAATERLDYELGVIRRMKFANYFLVVWDFVKFAKERGILVGPGRGSAAGSIVTYSLGITALDPLKYGLLFERFLNADRLSMPDIDIDFADNGRNEVIDYVVRKYGDDRVAQIVTFGTLAAKASVRDVGRAMGLSFADTDRVAKLIPTGPKVTIESAMSSVPELKALYDGEAHLRELIDAARKVEGIARHASTHAAGVVISRDPLVDYVPLQRAGGKAEGEVTTQYQMGHLEELGLLKMDFLGLSTLTILGMAVELAQKRHPELTLESIPLDDPKSYELLRRGETVGIFQLEGGMTSRMTTDIQPDCFEDVIALMALIRPGPMEMAPDYIARKRGRTPITYAHPSLEPILKETYGIALYQEQVMQIANVLSGFTMAEGDGLRKAMGKKLPEVMAKYESRFVEGAVEKGIERALAAEIWDGIERFAGYGFNKAHSAAYAVIAAQTAFLKANYPVEYMAALMTNDMGNSDRMALDVAECRRASIEVLPPDVNRSEATCSVEIGDDGRGAVRFGLSAVKNAGEGAVRAILAARAGQPGGMFRDLDSFCRAIDWNAVSKRAVECLAKAGALDTFGSRAAVMNRLEGAIAAGQQEQKATARGQMGLFGVEVAVAAAPLAAVEGPSDISRKQMLAWEKELIGLYLSDHPLKQVLDGRSNGYAEIVTMTERPSGERVRVIGMVTGVRRVTTKANRSMAVMELEDLTGAIELVAFPEVYETHGELWQTDAILEVQAKVDRRGDQLQLICEFASAELSLPAAAPRVRTIRLSLVASDDVWDDIRQLQELGGLLERLEGEDEVELDLPRDGGRVTLKVQKHRVEWGDEFAAALARTLPGVRVEVSEPLVAV